MRQLFMRRRGLQGLSGHMELPQGFNIRVATIDDAEGIAEVLRVSFDDLGWTAPRALRELIEAPDVKKVFVVVAPDGRIAATASSRSLPDAYPGQGYVHYVGAHSDFQGLRLGYWATYATLLEFKSWGCAEAVLDTDDWRLPAIKTYLRLGFEPEFVDPSHEDRWTSILAEIG